MRSERLAHLCCAGSTAWVADASDAGSIYNVKFESGTKRAQKRDFRGPIRRQPFEQLLRQAMPLQAGASLERRSLARSVALISTDSSSGHALAVCSQIVVSVLVRDPRALSPYGCFFCQRSLCVVHPQTSRFSRFGGVLTPHRASRLSRHSHAFARCSRTEG